MCGALFGGSEPSAPEPVAPPAPPAPPAAQAPTAPALNDDVRGDVNRNDQSRVKRIGRSALRVDLTTPGASGGSGIQTPRG